MWHGDHQWTGPEWTARLDSMDLDYQLHFCYRYWLVQDESFLP